MGPIHRRFIIGPLITLAIAGAVLWSDPHAFRVPNPGAILFLAVAFSAYLGGMASGMASAAISIAFSAVHFSMPGELFRYTPDNASRMVVLSLCTLATVIMMCLLQARVQRAIDRERAIVRELTALRSALDQSEVGVMLLDNDLRAQFVNRAFRTLWRLPHAVAEQKPLFSELTEHARDTKAYCVPDEEMDGYITDRIARVRAGDEQPIDIRLANGTVIRCRCKPLTEGGRMLTYGNVSDLVASAEEFAELAMRDALTGIYNRRHFMSRLAAEWNRFQRYRRPLSLLMLDIDHFKSINDRYGHDVGDQVIVHVATLCGPQTRASDLVARIGGEEFAVLLPETELNEACIVGERLRECVAQTPLKTGAGEVSATISVGVAAAGPGMSDPADLMKRADECLYAAKRGGRNRMAVAPGETQPTETQPAVASTHALPA